MDKVYAVRIERQYNMDCPGDEKIQNKIILFKEQDKAIKYLHTNVQADFLEEMSDFCDRDCTIRDLIVQDKEIDSDAPEMEAETKLSAWITEEPVH